MIPFNFTNFSILMSFFFKIICSSKSCHYFEEMEH
ncbi:hypothetical protein GLYMA_12G228751v4 [Glycine max]|nr:hypothetical protein GLYMA_12G228751v4 [Glycine max]KAH1144504.1 hypothetical protein GYH30_034642 [Glycine max]